MVSIYGTPRAAGVLPALCAGILGLAGALQAGAETLKTVNGDAIDSSVFEFYVQSRADRPLAQISAEEREALLSELTDIFLLSTQQEARELSTNPQIAAQIELQRRGILAQAVASRFFSGSSVSEEEIQAEYDEQSGLAPPMQYKARHILVESQGEASDLIAQLDGGADFIELAKNNSVGPSAPNGGDLGWFSPNQMVQPFSEATSALEDGGYTAEPVQTQFGWHVILREDSREAEAPPLDTVRDEIQQVLQQRKFQAYLESLRSDADIED